jgi:exosortase
MASASPKLINPAMAAPAQCRIEWLQFSLVTLLIAALYFNVLADLAKDWWTEPAWSYGLLIPPLALYAAWIQRQTTLRITPREDYRGLLVTAAASLLFLVGNLGAEFFLTRSSFILLLVGVAWTFWGLPRLRTLAFPFLLLATMVPLPVIVYNALAAPLQLFATSSATALARALGVTVYQDGNIIHLAHISLGVEEACSGLNSLAALVVASLLIAFLLSTRLRTRLLVILASVPLAIAFNVLRVAVTAVLADYHEEFAQGFYHFFGSWLIFTAGFATLYVFARILHRFLD